jgi:hypothetical protein
MPSGNDRALLALTWTHLAKLSADSRKQVREASAALSLTIFFR